MLLTHMPHNRIAGVLLVKCVPFPPIHSQQPTSNPFSFNILFCFLVTIEFHFTKDHVSILKRDIGQYQVSLFRVQHLCVLSNVLCYLSDFSPIQFLDCWKEPSRLPLVKYDKCNAAAETVPSGFQGIL